LLPSVRFISLRRHNTTETGIGRALGFPDTPEGLPSSVVPDLLEFMRVTHIKPGNTHVSSMLLDLRHGRPIEVEVIVGEVVRMAKTHNVPVPVSVLSDAKLDLALTQP
jgi:ketopantoate reductase